MNTKTILKQCVGIDVSMKKVDCCLAVYTQDLQVKVVSTSKFENNGKGLLKLRQWIEKKSDKAVCLHVNMEATGVYHEDTAYFLSDLGFKLSIIQPAKGKQYARSLDEKNKTDRIDAIMLARMGLERDLPLWNRPTENLRILKRLSRERISIIRDRNALTNQLHALNHSHKAYAKSIKRLKQRVKLATKQLAEIEVQMQELVAESPVLHEKMKHVITIPGINFVTAATVIAETDGFSNIGNRRQLVSYAGLDVVIRESGTLAWRPRISKRGNAYIRAALYMAAVCSIIHNQTLRIYFNRLKENGKPGKTGVIALERKLLILIYTLYKNNTDYVLGHTNNSQKDIVLQDSQEPVAV